jgi:hypothetical protein
MKEARWLTFAPSRAAGVRVPDKWRGVGAAMRETASATPGLPARAATGSRNFACSGRVNDLGSLSRRRPAGRRIARSAAERGHGT